MFQRLKLFIILISLLAVETVFGGMEVDRRGTTAASFRQLEVGAAAIGAGGAFVGLADDATALYWNPAAITRLSMATSHYTNQPLYVGIRHQFLGVVLPVSHQTSFGFSVNTVSVPDMEQTTLTSPDGTGQYFDASDLSAGLTWARRLTNRVSVGGSVHLLQQRIWHQRALGMAVDLASHYLIEERGVGIGMVVTNLGPDMSMDDGPLNTYLDDPASSYPGSPDREVQYIMRRFPLPLTFHLGLSLQLAGEQSLWLKQQSHDWLLLGSINDAFDAPLRAALGTIYRWNDLLILRGGYRLGDDPAGLSLGVGLRFRLHRWALLECDYAWLDMDDLGASEVWSLELKHDLSVFTQ